MALNQCALVYCSVWPGSPDPLPLERQRLELQAYCRARDLDVVRIEEDAGPAVPGVLRPGLFRAMRRVEGESPSHLVVADPLRLGRNSAEAMARIGQLLRGGLVLHVASWGLSSLDAEFHRTLSRFLELVRMDAKNNAAPAQEPRDAHRLRPLWRRIFTLLQDERYAESLIQVLFDARQAIRIDGEEQEALHGGYDHLQMFRALGFRIKGEDTGNTRLVADVLVRHWDAVKPRLGTEICREAERFGAGAVL
jgi:hypothetical protein